MPTKPNQATLTVLMLVKTTTEWLSIPALRRFELFQKQIGPILTKHTERVSLRLYDMEFYSARVTDVWMWEAKDHHDYELVVEELRDTPFWDRYFDIVEILPGVENMYLNVHGPVGESANDLI